MKKKFRIRASGASKIVGGHIGLSPTHEDKSIKLTDKETLTKIQNDDLAVLEYHKANPSLPEGLKTFCENWAKEQFFKRRKNIKVKYFIKGNVMEGESIERMAEHFNLGMVLKNEEFFDDDEYFQGTPDVILSDEVIDMKNSWDYTSFPLFEKEIPNMDYWWQLQVYMHLTGKRKARLIYYLSDTPMNLIAKEARYDCLERGLDEMDVETYEKHVRLLTYDDIPVKDKIKSYDIIYDEVAINLLIERVKICREYIETLN